MMEDDSTTTDTDLDLEEDENVRPSGKVVGILRSNWKPYCGSLDPSSSAQGYTLFKPVDKTIPKIRIKTKQLQELINKRIVVCIDGWDVHSRFAVWSHYFNVYQDIHLATMFVR
jgi:exosome complex exonuclease DIS3/RRP44